MTPPSPRAGAGDCERCRDGLISQPINAASSLGYVAAGAASLRTGSDQEPIEHVVGWSTIAAGIGSVAFHGPGGRRSRFVHDAGLLSLLGSIAVANLFRRADRRCDWPIAAAVPVAATALAGSRWNDAAQVAVGTVTVVSEATRLAADGFSGDLANQLIGPVAGVGALAHLLGRTGGPLCSPDSLAQPHAAWHLITAATVWLRARNIHRT